MSTLCRWLFYRKTRVRALPSASLTLQDTFYVIKTQITQEEESYRCSQDTYACAYEHDFALNPNPATSCQIFGLKSAHTYTPADNIFGGPVTNLLSILCILIEILSRAHAKEAKKPQWFRILHFCSSSSEWQRAKHGSERVKWGCVCLWVDSEYVSSMFCYWISLCFESVLALAFLFVCGLVCFFRRQCMFSPSL